MDKINNEEFKASNRKLDLSIYSCPKLPLRGFDLTKIASRVAEVLSVKPEDIWARGRYRKIVETLSLFCYWAVRELGVSMSSLSSKLGISIPAVGKSVIRGRQIAEKRECSLLS